MSRADLATGSLLPPHILTGTESELLLITDPDDRMIDRLPREQQLRAYWRVLFEAAVMREIDRKVATGTLNETSCLARLERFGLAAAREIRSVLLAEHRIAPDAGAVARFRSFAATYLDLIVFARPRADDYFPSLPMGEIVSHALAEDLDFAILLAKSRPVGAADLDREPLPDEDASATEPLAPPASPDEPVGLLGQSLDAEQKGSNVRAAILRGAGRAGGNG